MMQISPEQSAVSIVLVGNLNPRIFHPSWFVRNDLISVREGDAADVEVVHREIAIFQLEWVTIKVEPHRFIAQTAQSPFVKTSDLVVRTFKEFLSHTPIGMLGINRNVHFRTKGADNRNEIGKQLAPHTPWGEWGPQIEGETTEKRGGLRSLTMEQRDLSDREFGHIRTKIEPSNKLHEDGIFMEVNDHYQVEKPDEVSGCEQMLAILEEHFDASIQRSEWIIDQIMAKV